MRLIRLCLYVFLLLSTRLLQASYFPDSDYVFRSIDSRMGLSHNKVSCILRDKQGFVWVGTRSGLNRFDGKNIVVMHAPNYKGCDFSEVEVYDLYEDNSGIIWIASSVGLFYYTSNDETINFLNLQTPYSCPSRVYCIESDSDRLLWLGTDVGVLKYDRVSLRVSNSFNSSEEVDYSLTNNVVSALCKNGNDLWVGTSAGLDRVNIISGLVKHYVVRNDASLSTNYFYIHDIECDVDNTIWVGSDYGGLSKYDATTDSFFSLNTSNSSIPYNDVRDIFKTSTGDLLLATNGGGISLFKPKQEEFSNTNFDGLNSDGISNNSVYVVYEDYENVLWLGYYAAGLSFSSAKLSVFQIVKNRPNDDNSICESNVRSLYLDTLQNLWVGTLGGLSHYNKQKGQVKSYTRDENNIRSISSNKVTSIVDNGSSDIWISTYSGGVNRLNANDNTFQHYNHIESDTLSITSNNVYVLRKDGMGRIWAAQDRGVDIYDKSSDSWENVHGINCRDILFVDDTLVYFSAIGGVFEYHSNTEKREQHYIDDLQGVALVSLRKGNNHKIWFASQGKGIGYFDTSTKKFSFFGKANGLPSNICNSIELYGDDQIWVSTSYGLSVFDIIDQRFTNYGLAEGLPFLEFYPNSSTYLSDSSLAFGGTEGLVVFKPQEVYQSFKASKLCFSQFEIDGNKVNLGDQSVLQKSISYTHDIKLKYDQNDFSFEFLEINFKSQELGGYAYVLEGYMDEWKTIGNRTNIGFTNMNPGNYVLRVRKLGGNVEKGFQDEITMNITIVPPFWMTWYFYVLMILLVIAIVRLYANYSLISIKKENAILLQNIEYEKQEEYQNLRMKFFTYISHELRTPLSLIVDPLSQLKKTSPDEASLLNLNLIEKSTVRLQRLVNQILEFRKLEDGALQLQVASQDYGELMSSILSDFESVAKSQGVIYTVENTIDTDIPIYLDADKLEKVVYNLLNNAFKFTSRGQKVSVLSALDGDHIHISIIDTGEGMSPSTVNNIFDYYYTNEGNNDNNTLGAGIGLHYVKKLISLHYGRIEVKSEEGIGSRFDFLLPITKEFYSDKNCLVESTTSASTTPNINLKFPEHTPTHPKSTPLILLVEDEHDLREYTASRLMTQFRVVQASNGKDAIAKIKKNIPDLILSDNVMPLMDGVTLCNTLKEDKAYRHIPFLFLSAWNSDDYKLSGLQVGAEDYLSKPFNYDILVSKITNILTKREYMLELAGQIIKVDPADIELKTQNEQFVLKAQNAVETYINKPDFSAKDFEQEMAMSHAALYSKLKELTGLSAIEFIREYRVRRAVQILKQDPNLSILEVSVQVGFNDAKYFSRCFKKTIGQSPSLYRKNICD